MRTKYRNGDPISLTHTGCNSCSPSMINRTLCHESGCPDAWKDYPRECIECDAHFYSPSKHQKTCHRHRS